MDHAFLEIVGMSIDLILKPDAAKGRPILSHNGKSDLKTGSTRKGDLSWEEGRSLRSMSPEPVKKTIYAIIGARITRFA